MQSYRGRKAMPTMTIRFEGGGELTIEREGERLIRHIATEVLLLREKSDAVGHWRAGRRHWIFAPSKVVALELDGIAEDFKLR
jgi:hypothetical protein